MKICGKSTGEHPCQSATLVNVTQSCRATLLNSHFGMSVLLYRTPFSKKISEGLLLETANFMEQLQLHLFLPTLRLLWWPIWAIRILYHEVLCLFNNVILFIISLIFL